MSLRLPCQVLRPATLAPRLLKFQLHNLHDSEEYASAAALPEALPLGLCSGCFVHCPEQRGAGGTAAQETKQSSTIAVVATRRTVETGCYPIEIRKRRPDITVVQQACPELAGSIERGLPRRDVRELVEQYVGELLNSVATPPDAVILGCTHYPLVTDLFAAALPCGVRIIHQPQATADALVRYLERHAEYDPGRASVRRFLTTGRPGAQSSLVAAFWGAPLSFERA